MNSLVKKVVAILLVFVLVAANLAVLGEYTIAYAASNDELNKQDSGTNNKNVLFNSYFDGEKHDASFDIGSEDAKLYVKLEVDSAGYVENGTIEFENANFKIKDGVEDENIQSIDIDSGNLVLDRVNNGSEIVVELPIEILNEDNVSTDNFDKEFTVKFTGTYIDEDGDEKQVTKEITNRLAWEGTAEAELAAEGVTFVPYTTNGNYGVMVQEKVNVGVQDNALPIKHTNIEIIAPELNGTKPTSVKVVATSMAATNGKDEGLDFTSDNYTYDSETGEVTIDVDNLEDSISWLKDVQDEYLVTYLYEGEDIYNYASENGMSGTTNVTANLTLYNSEDLETSQSLTVAMMFTEKEGDIASFDVEVPDNISKGYIYANYDIDDDDDKEETEYSENYIATVNMADLVTSITFEQGVDAFVTEDDTQGNTTISGKNYAYNKRVEVRQDIFEKMLGEDGSITIEDSDGKQIGTINKDSEVDDDKYVLDISDADTNQIKIITSQPLTEGQFEVNIVKALKGNIDYSKNQMKEFKTLRAKLTGKTDLTEENAEADIELKEPETKMELEVSNQDWTTVVTNENVEIRAILDTSSVYNALYKDTTLKIKFPADVDDVTVNGVKLLLDKGLEIETATLSEEDGQKVITIQLSGTQTEYAIDADYKGAIVVLYTDITLDTLAASGEEKVTLEYSNGNDVGTNRKGTVEEAVNIVAPTGVVASTGISNYNDEEEDVVSVAGEDQTVAISPNSEAKTATVEGAVVNNYKDDIGNIRVLGRIPAEGSTETDSDEELGSTFTIPLESTIDVSGVNSSNYTIYYSENANATQDLDDEGNAWSTDATTSSKSYLIDFDDDYVMESGDKFEFEYDISIPADVSYNNSSYAVYEVYYDELSDIGTISETKESATLGVSTGSGPEADIELSCLTDTVREEQVIEMTATITNTGDEEIENAQLKVDAPEGTAHTEMADGELSYTDSSDEEKIIDVGDIAVGDTATVRYELHVEKQTTKTTVNPNGEEEVIEEAIYPGDREVENVVSLLADNIEGEIKSDTYTFTLQEGDLKITNASTTNQTEVLKRGKKIIFEVAVENVSNDKTLNNVTIQYDVPDGIEIEDVYYSDSSSFSDATTDGVTINGNSISVNVGTLQSIKAYMNSNDVTSGGTASLRTKAYICIELRIGTYQGDFAPLLTGTADEIDTHYSNVRRYTVASLDLDIVQDELDDQYIKEGTQYSYHFTISNNSDAKMSQTTMKMTLPDGLSFVQADYTLGDGTTKTLSTATNDSFSINLLELDAGEEADVTVTVEADMLTSTSDKEVVTSATVSASGISEIESNEVTAYIEYDPTADHSGLSGGYKITGTAWLDDDQNGQRDADEQLLEGIDVLLLDKDTNEIVKDADTNEDIQTTTGSDGTYELTDLPNGDYLVVFVYDSSNFSLTEYQKDGVSESFNSDAIDVNLTLNGENTIAGITDTITIDDDNARNIDIGLYTASKFDLRLDKYISKITVTTPAATNSYSYNNSEIAKVEIPGRYLGESSAVIEFTIAVTNEGSVAGYVNKIVDYLPDEYTFSTELNTDWYLSDNGNIYNSSLDGEIINPGETKEVTLVVSTQITQDLLGTVTNNAEIYESYNDLGLSDIDSTPANQMESEDDMGKADIVFSLNTGKVVTYTAIVLIVIAIIGFGIFEIKKHVLDKKV